MEDDAVEEGGGGGDMAPDDDALGGGTAGGRPPGVPSCFLLGGPPAPMPGLKRGAPFSMRCDMVARRCRGECERMEQSQRGRRRDRDGQNLSRVERGSSVRLLLPPPASTSHTIHFRKHNGMQLTITTEEATVKDAMDAQTEMVRKMLKPLSAVVDSTPGICGCQCTSLISFCPW